MKLGDFVFFSDTYGCILSDLWCVSSISDRSFRIRWHSGLALFLASRRLWPNLHTSMSMIWALPQIRNHPYVFCPRSLTRAVTILSLEKYLDWDDILEFWALNQHFGERMDHGSRPISAYSTYTLESKMILAKQNRNFIDFPGKMINANHDFSCFFFSAPSAPERWF